MTINQHFHQALTALRATMTAYSPLSEDTWQAFTQICRPLALPANSVLYAVGETPRSFAFIYRGLTRTFICDTDGKEYNKRFFAENAFPGVMVALLLEQPAKFSIETLEDSELILIDHKGYRELLKRAPDLQAYHIQYLEKNWLIKQEKREVALVQQDASSRYQAFLADNPGLDKRLPLFHIASHLGITATQLSRIRKQLKSTQNQHM